MILNIKKLKKKTKNVFKNGWGIWTLVLSNLVQPKSALRSINANVSKCCKRSPTVRLISAVSGERLQPIANGF